MAHALDAKVHVGPRGRLVIPANVRRRLSLKAGDVLLLQVQGETLLLEKRETVLSRMRSWFEAVPEDVSLVDELLAERQAEVQQE